MSFPKERESNRRQQNRLVLAAQALVLLFLLANLAARAWALRSAEASPVWQLGLVVLAGLLGVASLLRPAWLGAALTAFGTTLILCGFHSYSTKSQLFELAVTGFAVLFAVRRLRGRSPLASFEAYVTLHVGVLYALAASFSLLLLPPRVLEQRAYVEGAGLVRAALASFAKDPLYPIAGVDRLWLFLAFAGLLAVQTDGRALYRRLVRGIAWGVMASVVLGLLDFFGVLPLARYNQAHVFFGAEYRRLQSTFGNPSWFACFVVCSLPWLLLEWHEVRRGARLAWACGFPLVAMSLFLTGARAAWIALLFILAALAALRLSAHHLGRPFPAVSPLGKAVLAASVAAFGLLAGLAYVPAATHTPDLEPPGRLEGLSREMRVRGVGFSSPRRVAAEYALALASERPLWGLGYESFNMHLRAQLAIPGSPVARVVNTAVAQDPSETVFDDSHDTYLQALTGTGAVGLLLWLALAGSALLTAARGFRHAPGAETAAVVLGMLVFHLYGLFQGMAYVPVVFFLFFVALGFSLTLETDPSPPWLSRTARTLPLLAGGLALASLPAQLHGRGYGSLKQALGVAAYLPDERAGFQGFYAPETGPSGEFRWMGRRGIVNVPRAGAFRLAFTCAQPDLERAPVVVSLRFDSRDLGSLLCQRPGTQERRFDLGSPGALRVAVSRTFRPEGEDRRELGVAVSSIRWE